MIAFPETWITFGGLGIAAVGIVLAIIRRRLFGAKVSESRLAEYVEYPEASYE